MMLSMRVGIVSIQHESNTFLPSPTTLDDFKRHGILTGEQITHRYGQSHHELGGFLAALEAHQIEPVPLLMARATPGGIITSETAGFLLSSAVAALSEAGPLDGLLVAPHGAAVAQEYPDFDGTWLTAMRQRLDGSVPIICTLDPHANVSKAMIDACHATILYHTNPHLDQFECGLQAGQLMAAALAGEIKPVQAGAFPPLQINIERQRTGEPHCQVLYKRAAELRKRSGVLSSSIVLGFPYADVEKMGSGAVVVTDGDLALARQLADDLANEMWQRRASFAGELIDISEALSLAKQIKGTVGLLDMGDNVGGGSPGDSTDLAWALRNESNLLPAFVCLYDPKAQKKAQAAGPGSELDLSMGAKISATTASCGVAPEKIKGPIKARVKVISLHEGYFTETKVRHGGKPYFDMGPTAVVQAPDGLTVMLTSQRTAPFSLGQLTCCGVDPSNFRTIVIKGVHAPIAAYQGCCNEFIRVNTPGVTTADMTKLAYCRRRKPLYPLEAI